MLRPRPLAGQAEEAMAGLTQSYVHGATSVPLIGQTIGAWFDAAARRWAERDA